MTLDKAERERREGSLDAYGAVPERAKRFLYQAHARIEELETDLRLVRADSLRHQEAVDRMSKQRGGRAAIQRQLEERIEDLKAQVKDLKRELMNAKALQ